MKILTLLLLLVSPVYAFSGNPVDQAISDSLAWGDPTLASNISDFTLWGNIIGSGVFAITRKENRTSKFVITVAAHAGNTAMNYIVKILAQRERPNGKDKLSFYSGHTSTSFVSAGIICSEDRGKICGASLGLATLTGYLRIAAKYHWPSDVVVGAGVGYVHGKYVPTISVIF